MSSVKVVVGFIQVSVRQNKTVKGFESFGVIVIITDTYRSATCDFLLKFHTNHGPISYHRDKRRFQTKIAKFSHSRVFCVLGEGVPLGIKYRRTESNKKLS